MVRGESGRSRTRKSGLSKKWMWTVRSEWKWTVQIDWMWTVQNVKVNVSKTKSKGSKGNESERSQLTERRLSTFCLDRPIFLGTVHFQNCPLKTGKSNRHISVCFFQLPVMTDESSAMTSVSFLRNLVVWYLSSFLASLSSFLRSLFSALLICN